MYLLVSAIFSAAQSWGGAGRDGSVCLWGRGLFVVADGGGLGTSKIVGSAFQIKLKQKEQSINMK